MPEVIKAKKRWWLVAERSRDGKIVDMCFDQRYGSAHSMVTRIERHGRSKVLLLVYDKFWSGYVSGTRHTEKEMRK